ncbi:MAG: helix-turn-helix domain-containing protein [Eubacteriales bacterium]|nr:helix-turn-helix domain-containing protein [Eubacteriales bacterium]
MNDDILNIEQALEFLGVSEKTLIKLLREEHIPARKIGREWRFSREALIRWLGSGDSIDYINQNDRYMISEDVPGTSSALFDKIGEVITTVTEHDNNIRTVLQELERDIIIPQAATLRISYKQQREVEKLEFKIFWEQREEANQKYVPPGKRIE